MVNDEYNLKIISYNKEITSEDIEKEIKLAFPNLITSSIGKSEKIQLLINDEKLLIYNISKTDILEFIKLKLGEEKLLNLNYGKNYIPVAFSKNGENINSLLNSKFMTKTGNQYNLKDFIDIKFIEQKEGVEADVGGVADILYVKSEKPELIVDYIKKNIPIGMLSFEGSFKFIDKLKQDIFYILIITLILLYLILAIQFESLKLPIIILLEIPIDIAFSLLILKLSGQTLNVMSFIGIIIMCGIIINDSILKIDLIRKQYLSGINIQEAIHTAGKRRLNAILMTSLTTLLAITPILFQNDTSTQLQAPLIIALIGGLSIGTLVSIFIIPLVYRKLI